MSGTTKRKRTWRHDRMLALKMVCPPALDAIAEVKYFGHDFDRVVCRFFEQEPSAEFYETLRPIARRLVGPHTYGLHHWNNMAKDIVRTIEGDWK